MMKAASMSPRSGHRTATSDPVAGGLALAIGVASEFSDWWAYLAAPLAGGAAAVALYDRFLRAGSTPA
jgi:glycerol uptake facilitator-like aquaporin